MEEQEAVTRRKQGDLSGLEWLVRRFQAKALGAAYLVLHDRSLSEEIVQRAFFISVPPLFHGR